MPLAPFLEREAGKFRPQAHLPAQPGNDTVPLMILIKNPMRKIVMANLVFFYIRELILN